MKTDGLILNLNHVDYARHLVDVSQGAKGFWALMTK